LMPDSPVAVSGTSNPSPAGDAIGAMPLGELLGGIARKTPAPGGGAVASAAGALAAALAGMVVAYSSGKKSLAAHAAAHEHLAERFAKSSCSLLELADADAEAYTQLNALQRLDKSDARRASDLARAASRCVGVPLSVQDVCVALLEDFKTLAPIANRWLLSDLKIAAILAEATVRASACNVLVNAPTLAEATTPNEARRATDASNASCGRAHELLAAVETLLVTDS